MMLRIGMIVLIALLAQASANAGVNERSCHLLEPQVYALLAQDDPKDENSRRDGGVGGTGIVAEITSTSPLRMAGCNIEITAATTILDEEKPMEADELARGQVAYVTLNARDGRLRADSIVVQHVLEGVVAKSGVNTELEILGKAVVVVPGRTQMPSLPFYSLLGSNVKVSGFRLPDGKVLASRIDTYDYLEAAGTTGVLERNGTGFAIGGIELSGMLDPARVGSAVSALGNWTGSMIEVSQFEPAGWRKAKKLPQWVLLEGRLRLGKPELTGLVDGPQFDSKSSALLREKQMANGDPISVFGRRLRDGSIQVHQFWRN